MPIRVECDVCGAKYRVDERRAGTEIPCKECDADMWVPEVSRRGRSRRPARGGRSRGAAGGRWGDFDLEDDPHESESFGSNSGLLVLGLVAGGLVLAGVIFAVMFSLKEDPAGPKPIAQNDPAEPAETEQLPPNANPAPPAQARPQPKKSNPQPKPVVEQSARKPKSRPFNRQPQPQPEPAPKPGPVNNPVVNAPPRNPGAAPQGFQPPAEPPAPLPPDLAGTWDVKFDPAPEAIAFEEGRKLRVPFPANARPEEVLWPTTPSFFVGLGNNRFEREFREVYDIRNRKKLGRIYGISAAGGKHALSPDGKYFAVSNHRSKGVYVWDVENEKPKGTLPLESSWGAKALGFAGPKRLAALADSKSPLQIWSLPSGDPERSITLPDNAVEQSVTFSPGGRYVAVFNKKKEHPAIHVFDLDTGQFAGAISVPRKGDNAFWVPNCHALMFSPDGEEIAGLFEETFNGKYFYAFSLKDRRQVFDYKFEDDRSIWWLNANSSPIQWFPNKKRWLIFGNLLLDRDVGKVVWKFSADKNTAPARRILNDGVMMGVTLEKGQPTLLSFPVDEEKIAKVADTVSVGGKIVDAKLPPLTAIDRARVRPLSLDAGLGRWSAQPDPAPAGESPLKDSVSVTATGGRMTNLLLSNPQAGRAVVYSQLQGPGIRGRRPGRSSADTQGAFAHIDVYDLRTGQRSDQMDLEFATQLAAYSPSGNRIATVLQPDQDRVDIWSVADGKPVLALRPYNEEDKNHRRVTACAFVDDDHLLTLNNQKKLVLWKFPECQAVYEIAEAAEPGLSPNQKYLAVSTGHGYLLLDSRTGEQAGSFHIEGTMHAAAFHPDGTRFAASCTGPRGPSIVIWSMKDGSVLTEFPIQTTAQNLHFCNDDHLLMNNTTLIDVENELIVWRYRLASGAHSPQSPDGRHWYVTPRGASGAELIAATLPEPKVEEHLAMKELKPDFLLQPGGQVSAQINLPDSGPGQNNLRQRARQNLVAKYQNTGTSVGGGSDLVVTMDLSQNDTGKNQDLVISKSRTPFGGGIFNRGGEEISVPIKKIDCRVTFTYQGKVLNERKASYSNTVSRFFGENLKEGFSAEEHLDHKMWGMAASFFTGYSPPVYVFRDFEGKGFGLSTLSDRGPLPQGVGG